MFSNEDVARYYDLSEVHYKRFWNLDKSKSLHYGYWDENTKTFHEALININKVMADLAGVKPGDKVLDAGCGVGGSSIWLSREKGCQVVGISLNARQVKNANAFAASEHLQSSVSFEQQDFTNTTFADNSFDVVWAIESVCHAPDKAAFIREAFRVLKKGGTLVLADFFKKDGLQGKDAEIIKAWAHGWAVPDFATIQDFKNELKSGGFTAISIKDATSAIHPSAKKLYKAYLLGFIPALLYRTFFKATHFSRKNVETAQLQFKSLKKHLWNYVIFTASK